MKVAASIAIAGDTGRTDRRTPLELDETGPSLNPNVRIHTA